MRSTTKQADRLTSGRSTREEPTMATPTTRPDEFGAQFSQPAAPAKTEREQFLDDVIITAVEGGIGYWSTARAYRWSDDGPTTCEIREHDDNGSGGGWCIVNRENVRRSLGIITDKTRPLAHMSDGWRSRIAAASRANDCGELDAGDCDAIVQVAVLGEVVYG